MIPFAHEIWNVIYNNSRENYNIYLFLTNFIISKSLAFKLVFYYLTFVYLTLLFGLLYFTVFVLSRI